VRESESESVSVKVNLPLSPLPSPHTLLRERVRDHSIYYFSQRILERESERVRERESGNKLLSLSSSFATHTPKRERESGRDHFIYYFS